MNKTENANGARSSNIDWAPTSKKRLVGYFMSPESIATTAFLTWQQRGESPDVIRDAETSLRAGKGVPSVVLVEDDVQLAVGFWNITKYWQAHGLCLL